MSLALRTTRLAAPLVGAAALLLGGVAAAGPADHRVIDATARWFVHVDMDAMRGSTVVTALEKALGQEALMTPDIDLKPYGFDINGDIASMTMYGGEPMNEHGPAAMVAVSNARVDALAQSIREGKVPGARSATIHGVEMMVWAIADRLAQDVAQGVPRAGRDAGGPPAPPATWYAVARPGPTADTRTLVMGPEPEMVTRALRVIDGEVLNLQAALLVSNAPSDAWSNAPAAREGAFVMVAVRDMGKGKGASTSSFLKEASGLYVELGESAADPAKPVLFLNARIDVGTEQQATRMQNGAQLMLGFVALSMAKESAFSGLAELPRAVSIRAQGASVRIEGEHSAADIVKVVSEPSFAAGLRVGLNARQTGRPQKGQPGRPEGAEAGEPAPSESGTGSSEPKSGSRSVPL